MVLKLLLGFLIRLRVNIIVVKTISRLENVEDGVGRHGFDNGADFVGLLVLLLLLGLLFGQVFTIFPLDFSAFGLEDILTIFILVANSDGELGVGEPLVFGEMEC